MRKAITDYYNSIIPEGLTQSRYPTEPRQVIPTYSLFWVSMIHDYLWNRNDYMFAAEYLVSIQHILQWFENRIDQSTGMLGAIEYWPFVDWTNEWPWDNNKRIGGVPDGGQEGNSSIITLQYAMTLDQAADIFSFFGLNGLSNNYSKKADALIAATKKHCWVESRGLFADTPEKSSFSQHANTFAVLTNAIPKIDQPLLMEEVMRDKSLIQASNYFKFYVNRAAIEAGLGNKYISNLGPWKDMINMGLTTFSEIPDTRNTRSDCHAWSSSPLFELITTVAGIKPAGVGFETVIIEPHPGGLKWIKAGMPHFYGDIELDLNFQGNGSVKGSISIPPGLKGVFLWDNQTIDLIPGKQKVDLDALNSRFIMN
jgi:glycogen debranching enzyme